MKVRIQAILRDGYGCEVTVTNASIKDLECQHIKALSGKSKTITLADEKSSTIIPVDKIQYIRLVEVFND